MDIGDLLIVIFIVSGLLSSLAGGKKKQRQRKAQPLPRPPKRQSAPRPGAPPAAEPWVDTVDSGPVPSQMEQILRQLGLDVESEPEEPEEALSYDEVAVLEPESTAPREPVRRETPRVVSLEGESLENVGRKTETRHEEFHQRYVRSWEPTETARQVSRARRKLNPGSLREAFILKEILGPPKGLQ